ncbi:MAG: hypothetical protein ACP6IS_03935 [Candidatus Asgardarchaeia archaeon]
MSYLEDLTNQIGRLPVKIASIMNEEKTKLSQTIQQLFYVFLNKHNPLHDVDTNELLFRELQTSINKAFENATLQIVTLVRSSNSRVVDALKSFVDMESIDEIIRKMDSELKSYKIENKKLRKLLGMTDLFQVLHFVEKKKVTTRTALTKSLKISSKRLTEILSLLEKEKLVKVDKTKRPYRVILKKSISGVIN